MGTSLDRASSVKDLYQRGSAYGIPRRDVNGMDLMAVRSVLGEAIDRARKEKRPTLIEAETYRYRGHSMSDPGKYRTKEEVEEMMQSDPILLSSASGSSSRSASAQADLDAMDKEVIAADRRGRASASPTRAPIPRRESLYEDVYVRSPYINMKAAEKDPAWKAAIKEDRVPPELPPSSRLPRRQRGGAEQAARRSEARRPSWRRARRRPPVAPGRAGQGGGLARWPS